MKTLRTPYLSMFLALLVLSTSCTQYENENTKEADNLDLTAKKSNTAKEINIYTQKRDSIQAQYKFSDELTAAIHELHNKTVEERFEIALKTELFHEGDIKSIKDLGTRLKEDSFHNVVSDFERTILDSNLSEEKVELYDHFINILKTMNNLEPSIFANENSFAKGTSSSKVPSAKCTMETLAFIMSALGISILELGPLAFEAAVGIIGYVAIVGLMKHCEIK